MVGREGSVEAMGITTSTWIQILTHLGTILADGIWLICWGMNVGCERRGIKLNSAALSLIDKGVFA